MTGGGKKAVVAALLANLGVALAKFVAFAFTGAASMLAEAIHSVADTSNQGLLLFGAHRAERKESPEHPFGYGAERYFWSFIVALVLFSLGGVFALFEGIEKLRHPHALESAEWAVGVLVVAMLLESFSLRTAVKEANQLRGDRTWWAFVRHAKVPELPVVLLEDLGALTGLSIALVCVGLAVLTGDPRFDAAGSVAIGILLCGISILLAKEMKSLLIGEAAGPERIATIRETIEAHDAVRRMIHLRTQHLGPEELLVAAKVELNHDLGFAEVVDTINQLEKALREKIPIADPIYLEPDRYREDYPTTSEDGV